MFKKTLQSAGRFLFLPPVVRKYGDQMSDDARKAVTRDLMILGVSVSIYAGYTMYLQYKIADMIDKAEIESIKERRRQLNFLNEPAKNFNSPTATKELTSPTADTPGDPDTMPDAPNF